MKKLLYLLLPLFLFVACSNVEKEEATDENLIEDVMENDDEAVVDVHCPHHGEKAHEGAKAHEDCPHHEEGRHEDCPLTEKTEVAEGKACCEHAGEDECCQKG